MKIYLILFIFIILVIGTFIKIDSRLDRLEYKLVYNTRIEQELEWTQARLDEVITHLSAIEADTMATKQTVEMVMGLDWIRIDRAMNRRYLDE